ncbi:MAG: rhomboid family intramembrane serine protease [Gemmatimonadetes bacterium]|nr:MAG: rhomboid family intramembrane serine protease [Gemmatimonadota bacterium]
MVRNYPFLPPIHFENHITPVQDKFMRSVGEFAEKEKALQFGTYLATQGIENEIRKDGADLWGVWVYQEAHVETARTDFNLYRENPQHPKFKIALKHDTLLGKIPAKKENTSPPANDNVIDMRERWASGRIGGDTYLTKMVIIACVVTFIYTEYIDQHNAVFNLLRTSYRMISAGEIWRFVTPIFWHGDVFHILFNMYWLHHFGGMIEVLKGKRFYLMLMLSAAIISNFGQYFLVGPYFGGMSGVVYGLFGFIWMKSRFEPFSGFFIDKVLVILMMGWFVACFVGIIPNVANWAHGFGLLVGVVFGYAPTAWRKRK